MKRVLSVFVVLLACSGTAAAKDLMGVFQDALHADPVIRQADANRRAAREARPQAWAAILPQINGTASTTRDHSAGFQDQITQLTPTSPVVVVPFGTVADTTTNQWGLSLRQNLFSWANWMSLKAASSEVAQAEATYRAAEQALILRVSQAYFNVLAAEDGLEANQTSLQAIQRQLDQAEKRFEVGLIAITDVQEAKAARDSAAAAVIAAKRTLATSEDQLQEITGQKYDALRKPGADMPLNSPAPADESRWVQVSLDQNLSLISSRLAADIARDNVRIAVGGHVPTLDV
ncbi:MAG: TolC family protein, partial [Steroidobacteraceae bacterium]